MTPPITILGCAGYVGSHLVQRANARGIRHLAIGRDLAPLWSQAHGTIIYTIGLTADFRQRPLETVEAHVCLLRQILADVDYERLIYLSSTRVYSGSLETTEDAIIHTRTDRLDDLYNLSKLMGESLCLSAGKPRDSVARLANVYGGQSTSTNFLDSIIDSALNDGHVELQTTAESAKDYIHILDVCDALLAIATCDSDHRLYNVACGQNTTNGDILRTLSAITGCSYTFASDASTWSFPQIDTARLRMFTTERPRDLLAELPALVKQRRDSRG